MITKIADFFSGLKSNPNIVSPLFGTNYWIGLSICIVIISTLFIFKKTYAKVSHFKIFGYGLAALQITLYVMYYTFHQLAGDIKWYDYFPFQLCSILDLLIAILLIFPSEKLFSITFPMVAPVVLAFLLPDESKRHFGPNNFFYYQYYLNHIIIVFGYFYLYLYGHVRYNQHMLKNSILSITLFGFFVFLFNTSYGTNFLFVGLEGYSAKFGSFVFDTAKWSALFRFIFMFGVAIFFLVPFHFLITKTLKPYYLNRGHELNPLRKQKRWLQRIKQKIPAFGKLDVKNKAADQYQPEE